MNEYVGRIYGTTIDGDFKVRSMLEKPTVLRQSRNEKFEVGNEIGFQPTERGIHVYFADSGSYRLLRRTENSHGSNTQPLPKQEVEFVFVDKHRKDVLVIGNWEKPAIEDPYWSGKMNGTGFSVYLEYVQSLEKEAVESLANSLQVPLQKVVIGNCDNKTGSSLIRNMCKNDAEKYFGELLEKIGKSRI